MLERAFAGLLAAGIVLGAAAWWTTDEPPEAPRGDGDKAPTVEPGKGPRDERRDDEARKGPEKQKGKREKHRERDDDHDDRDEGIVLPLVGGLLGD